MSNKSSKTTVRRYTLLNFYIRGSAQMPQAMHALSALNSKCLNGKMTEAEKALYMQWNGPDGVEVVLQGGEDGDMEDLFNALSKIEGLPCAKFNESQRALKGVCTALTFVANEKIATLNQYVRFNRKSPADLAAWLKTPIDDVCKEVGFDFSWEELFVVSEIAFLPLAS